MTADEIKTARRMIGASKSVLADALGVSTALVGNWETSRANLREETASRRMAIDGALDKVEQKRPAAVVSFPVNAAPAPVVAPKPVEQGQGSVERWPGLPQRARRGIRCSPVGGAPVSALVGRMRLALKDQHNRRYSSWHRGAEEGEAEPEDMQELKALIGELDAGPGPLVTLAQQTLAAKYEFLSWFAINCDFGPADDDVGHHLCQRYTEEAGKEVPVGWRRGE